MNNQILLEDTKELILDEAQIVGGVSNIEITDTTSIEITDTTSIEFGGKSIVLFN